MTPPELITHPPVSETASRLFVGGITFIIIAYDVLCMVMGWPTVSHAIRSMDMQVGGLVRWSWLALWAHFFISAWPVQNGL